MRRAAADIARGTRRPAWRALALAGALVLLQALAPSIGDGTLARVAAPATAVAAPPAEQAARKPRPRARPADSAGDATEDEAAKPCVEKDDDGGSAWAPAPPIDTSIPSVECMTTRAITTIFGLKHRGWVAKPTLGWILRVPTFVKQPGAAHDLGNAYRLTTAIGFSLLLAVVTFALLHYWAAGLTSQGGGAVLLEGVTRCAGAGLLILAWPWIFENVANLTNVVTHLLVPPVEVDKSILVTSAFAGLIGSFSGGFGGLIVAIVVLCAFVGLFLLLLLIKIGLMAGLLTAFVGMPIALALWPLPATSAPAHYAVRFVGMALTVLIVWALCFRVYGAVNAEFVSNHHDDLPARLLKPLVGLALLGVLVSVPRHAVAMWNIAPGGRGVVGSAMGYALSGMLGNAISQRVPQRLGGQRRPGGGEDGGESSSGGRGGGRPAGQRGDRASSGSTSGAGARRRNPQPAEGPPPTARPRPTDSATANTRSTGGRSRPRALPAASDADRGREALASLQRRRERTGELGPPDAAGVSGAVQRLDAAGYGSALRSAVGDDYGGTAGSEADLGVMGRMASAHVGAHPSRAAGDFNVIGAATPEVRRQGFEMASRSAPPARSTAPTPATPFGGSASDPDV